MTADTEELLSKHSSEIKDLVTEMKTQIKD